MIVDCAHYRDGRRQQDEPMTPEAAARICRQDPGFVWVGLVEPTPEELEQIQDTFGLHELAVEDAQSFVITVRQGAASDLHGARLRLEQRPALLEEGTGAVLWAILDKVVDDYVPVVEGLEGDIEEVERTVFAQTVAPTQRIYFLRREVTGFYRAVHPLLNPVEHLQRGDFPFVTGELSQYFRDVGDHLRLVNEEVAAQRDLLTTVLEANIAVISVQQNDVVRKISGWAAIITVPTFIASFYGMNFAHMPELDWTIAYPLVIVLMAVLAGGLWLLLKRARWL